MSETSILKEFRVTLETVTPLFLGGANQEPEIRAPSFRGGMRYWLRALLGFQYANNLSKIHEIEENVFGSTNQASSVAIRAREISRTSLTGFQDISADSGLGYLLWTAKNTDRQALDATTTKIHVIISCKSNHAYACASLWLLVHLGGLGSRSRRGLGSLKVGEDIEGWDSEFPMLQNNENNLQSFLTNGLERWQSILGIKPSTSESRLPHFDILHPSYSGIYIGVPKWNDWKTALDGLGTLLKESRAGTPPDHDGVLSVIKGEKSPQTVERAIYGLPMQFYYRGIHQEIASKHPAYQNDRKRAMRETRGYATASVTPSIRNSNKKLERRASPIHLKLAQQSDGGLVPVATFFMSDFLPNDYQLRVAPGGREYEKRKPPKFVQQPGYKTLKEFFDDSQWKCVFGGKFLGDKS